MKTVALVAHLLVRTTGFLLIILAFLFWYGKAMPLVPVSALIGILLALPLWVLAVLGARKGAHPVLVILSILSGVAITFVTLTGEWALCIGGSASAVWQGEELAAWIT